MVIWLNISNKKNIHWFLYKSLENQGQKIISCNSLFNVIKLSFSNKVILVDYTLFNFFPVLIFAKKKNISIILHGELTMLNSVDWRHRFYINTKLFVIKILNIQAIKLSEFIKIDFKLNFKVLSHPTIILKSFNKINYDLISYGEIDHQKISSNSYFKICDLLSKHNNFITHYGNINWHLQESCIKINGFLKNDGIEEIHKSHAFFMLWIDSKYENIVSGYVLQAISSLSCIVYYFKPDYLLYIEQILGFQVSISIHDFVKLNNYEKVELYKSLSGNLQKCALTLEDMFKFDLNSI